MPLRSAAALGISPSKRRSTCFVLAPMGSRNSTSSTTKRSLKARIWLRTSSFARTTPWSSREHENREKEEEAMKRQLGLSLVVLAVLAVAPGWSQSGSDPSQSGSTDQSQNGSTDQSQQSSTGPQAAYTHPEQLPPLTLLNEVTANTGIKLSMTTGLLTTHNSSYGSSGSYWENMGSFTGGVRITQIRLTLMWDILYNGGVSLSALST